jgi:hypothetical protein
MQYQKDAPAMQLKTAIQEDATAMHLKTATSYV